MTYEKRRYKDDPARKPYLIAANAELRKRRMTELLRIHGGCCVRCGYNRCTAALEFHHREPAEKKFNVNTMTVCKAWKSVLAEAEKCDLLCANCHREVHAAAWTISEDFKEAWQSGRSRSGANGVDRKVSEVRILQLPP